LAPGTRYKKQTVFYLTLVYLIVYLATQMKHACNKNLKGESIDSKELLVFFPDTFLDRLCRNPRGRRQKFIL
jgi:hypothetical protein